LVSETLPQTMPAQTPAPPTEPKAPEAAVALQALHDFLRDSIKDVSRLIEHKTSVFLVGFGSLVIVTGLAMMVNLDDDYQLADLTSGEFIAVLIVGVCLIALGAARTVLQIRGAVQVEQKKIEEGARLAGVIEGIAVDK
jgi:hypothetical protein